MKVGLDKAISYVRSCGDLIENSRLDCILWGKPPGKSVLQKLEGMQNPDGGFSYWLKETKISTVLDTIYILHWFDDLSIKQGPLVDGAIDFIFNHHNEDGSWDEVEDVVNFDPPPFQLPGKIENRVWLSANCAHWLMLFGHAESPKCRGCPVDFLLDSREPDGRLTGYLRATWDCLPVFARYPEDDREPFQKALAATEREFAPQDWEGSYLVWLIRCLRDARMESGHDLVHRSLSELVQKQRPDGSWNSEDGEEYSANATVEALRVLKDYKVI